MSKETAITTQSEHQLTLTPEEQKALAQRAEESVRKEAEAAREFGGWQADALNERYKNEAQPTRTRN